MQKKLSQEYRLLIILSLPLIASGFVEFSSGFAATFMLGHVSYQALAAGTLINTIFTTFMVIVWGIISAVSVTVAQHHGANNSLEFSRILRSALVLAFILAPLFMVALWLTPAALHLFKQSPELITLAKPGLYAFSWGAFPDLVTLIFLQFALGLGHSRINLLFSLLWTTCNIILVAAFIFGLWHFPKMGVTGLGWGFSTAMWILMILLCSYFALAPTYREYCRALFKSNKLGHVRSILKIGLPLGVTYGIDLVYFLIFALIMGSFGTATLAAHQIVMQFFWQTSVISFAIGQAITVRVGYHVGANTREYIAPITYIGIGFTAILMLITAIAYWVFPIALIHLDLGAHPNIEVTNLAIQFFAIAGIVQTLGAGWVGLLGGLRGLGDTRALMGLSALAEFCVGLPLACLFAYGFHLQGLGLWLAMIVDSCIFILLAYWRFKKVSAGTAEKISSLRK